MNRVVRLLVFLAIFFSSILPRGMAQSYNLWDTGMGTIGCDTVHLQMDIPIVLFNHGNEAASASFGVEAGRPYGAGVQTGVTHGNLYALPGGIDNGYTSFSTIYGWGGSIQPPPRMIGAVFKVYKNQGTPPISHLARVVHLGAVGTQISMPDPMPSYESNRVYVYKGDPLVVHAGRIGEERPIDIDINGGGGKCKTCCDEVPGKIEFGLNSIHIDIDFGRGRFGEKLDVAKFRLAGMISGELRASNIVLPSGVDPLNDSGGNLCQILAANTIVEVLDADEEDDYFRLKFYHRDLENEPGVDGLYEFSDPPFRVVTVQNADPLLLSNDHVVVTETFGGATNYTHYRYDAETNEWQLERDNGQIEILTVSNDPVANTTTKRRRILFNEEVISDVETEVKSFPFGGFPIRVTVDPDGSALTHLYEYYEDLVTAPGNYGKLKLEVRPDGGWVRYSHDALFGIVKKVEGLRSIDTDSPESDCRVKTFEWNPAGLPTFGRLERELVDGVEVSRRFLIDGANFYEDRRCVVPGAAWNDPANLVTRTTYHESGAGKGKVSRIDHPDGTVSLYSYTLNLEGDQLTTVAEEGVPNPAQTAIDAGKRTTTVTNFGGVVIAETVTDIESAKILDSRQAVAVDEFGRVTSMLYLDGTTETTSYNCCGVDSKTDRRGVVTTFSETDTSKTVTKEGVAETTLKSGLSTLVTRRGADNSVVVTRRSETDLAGRMVSDIDPEWNETLTGYSTSIDGLSVTNTLYPDGGTVVHTKYPGGWTKSIVGTAVVSQRMEYGVDVDGSQWTKTIILDYLGGDTGEWTKVWKDMLGRVRKSQKSGLGPVIATYDHAGRVSSIKDASGITTLQQTDALGRTVLTGIDVNNNGTIDLGGTDRISRVTASIAIRTGGRVVVRTEEREWLEYGVDASSVVKTTDVAVDGLDQWVKVNGLETHAQIVYSGQGAWQEIVTTPDLSQTTRIYSGNRLTDTVQENSSGVVISHETRRYDVFNRLWQIDDGVGNVYANLYDVCDRVAKVQAPKYETDYLYDSRGREVSAITSGGKRITRQYYETGNLKEVDGENAYPISFTYTPQGRIATMTTSKGVTTWSYHPDSGLLKQKLDAAGRGKVVSYTSGGQVSVATNGRGTIANYQYGSAGDLSKVSYDDGITPTVEFEWDRRGRLEGTSKESEFYHLERGLNGEVDAESIVGGVRDGMALGVLRDPYNRVQALAVVANGATIQASVFEYDATSRLSSFHVGTREVKYSYKPGSSLVSGIEFKNSGEQILLASKAYESGALVKRLDYKTGSGDTRFSVEYQFYADLQRKSLLREDGSLTSWEYNDRGEVTKQARTFGDGAVHPLQTEEFEFDDVGNRLTAAKLQGRTGSFETNALNQYTSRTVPPFLAVAGEAETDVRVVAQGKPVRRRGREFWKEWEVDNDSQAVREKVRVAAARPSGVGPGTSVKVETGWLFLPRTAEAFQYDEDGNLTTDGRWSYVWDAEDRLVRMEELSDTALNGWSRMRLDFGYDSFGRRYRKTVKRLSSAGWSIVSDNAYFYHGWNLVAEFEINGGATVPLRTYLWGMDLDGSFQGLGGVGGLLLVQTPGVGGGTFIPASDGNGNVIGYLDGDSGDVLTKSEYDAFGGRFKHQAVGSHQLSDQAIKIPIGYSSKYTEAESGLLYYGYRYYRPDVGRWISADPYGEAGGVNLYAFVQNDTVNYIDVLGMTPAAAVAAPGGAVSLWEGGIALGRQAVTTAGPYAAGASRLLPITAAGTAAVSAWSAAIDQAAIALAARYALAAEVCQVASCDTLTPLVVDAIPLLTSGSNAIAAGIRANDSKEADAAAQMLEQISMMLDVLRPALEANNCSSLLDISRSVSDVVKAERDKARELRMSQVGKGGGKGNPEKERGAWQLTREGADKVKRHGTFGTFYRSKSDKLWWSVDNAGHGGSAFKVFEESSSGLHWHRDADQFGDFIEGKHKGDTGLFIPWGQLH